MKKRLSKIRKQSKLPLAKLQRKLWGLCREVIRKKYSHDCYTCNAKNLSGSNLQTGHMIPKSVCGVFLKYDIRQLRNQCAKCNLFNEGMGAEFVRNMIIREGQEYVDGIFRDRNVYVRPYEHYNFLLSKYQLMLEEL